MKRHTKEEAVKVGWYVRGYDLNTLYSEAMPVFQKQQKATLYGEVAYEVQVKIVRRV